MNSPRELRRRIESITSMAQITRAMQMVAASKMRTAQWKHPALLCLTHKR
jgi:F-type H+-transporting ATPase subunit gamma